MFTLRPYQPPLVDQAEALMLRDRVPCIVAPTGSGKTVMIAEKVRRALARRERVVVVAHREEIVGQIVDSLSRHLGRFVDLEVIRAGRRNSYRAPVLIGMVPTMARRLERLAPLRGCTLLQDECHHAGATSWESVTEALAPRRRCGFTATPIRPNGKGLGDEGGFTDLVIGPQPGELMAMGALCRYRMFATSHQIDAKGIRKASTGDYRTRDLEAKVKEINGEIVRDWRRFNPDGHRTIFVGVSVEHAHEVAAMYRAEGIPAEAVDGTTPKGERAAIFGRFRSGKTTVLCACAVIDEGLDVPEATVLQNTRLTASIRLWRQLVGRVLRPAEGKAEALIIDHTTNWKELAPPDAAIEWELFQEKVEFQEKGTRKVNPDTGEVQLVEEPLLPNEIVENGMELVEITPDVLAQARPNIARKLLNERLRQELLAVEHGTLALEELRPWAKRTEVLEDDLIHRLGAALVMPAGWSAGQVMLNLLQSPKQVEAATRRLQWSHR